ncbi:MAG: type I DNA topoisomerase [Phycisphaera sp.]|nr:type I DNA topoisomerase [Phycisphaera sp.]
MPLTFGRRAVQFFSPTPGRIAKDWRRTVDERCELMAKKGTTSRSGGSGRGQGGRKGASRADSGGNGASASGKHLVIVESPAKAKTINKYLGSDYVVKASVGHIRDLPKRNPKGVKAPVPGVDIDKGFEPTYEVITGKGKTVTDLKRTAKAAVDVYLATDLDREGEAIAWHLAEALNVPKDKLRRVVFNAITKTEITRAFETPRGLDMGMVNAQQARRILDRIVGYQASPLLWKKVATGLSAGRVQSVAVRLVVEREREIDAFVPDEYWKITGYFATELDRAGRLREMWDKWLAEAPTKSPSGRVLTGRTIRERNGWLNEHNCLSGELIEVNGERFDPKTADESLDVLTKCGFELVDRVVTKDPKAKGPAANRVELKGRLGDPQPDWKIRDITTKRSRSRPYPPFITSSLQAAAANALGYAAASTMRLAQQLYEGVDIRGMGSVGLITYMRTDSTHLSGEALNMARNFIAGTYGEKYLPEKPNFFKSSNKSAQEAHEAIRPTDVKLTPDSPAVRASLDERQLKLYTLIWKRFVACQMVPAEWDSTSVLIGANHAGNDVVFKCTGRSLVFDGFYRAVGVPNVTDELILPKLDIGQDLAAIQIDPEQKFSSPPPRYNEASLVKKLENEGIGRPSTYAAIIKTIQDRKYVEKISGRFHATELGMVVTDKLMAAFPVVMDVGYTRQMESELDKVENENLDWQQMLGGFYQRFIKNVERAHDQMTHARAETQPAPHKCPKCGSPTEYRFGKGGNRFLGCTAFSVSSGPVDIPCPSCGNATTRVDRTTKKIYLRCDACDSQVLVAKAPKEFRARIKEIAASLPEPCDYTAPVDREGNPVEPEMTDIACPSCGRAMLLRKGRFGPFLSCSGYPECKGIVNLDKKGNVSPPKVPPLLTDMECPKCGSPLNLRRSKRGPWLSCSAFPKCRGRQAWTKLSDEDQKKWDLALMNHEKENPQPIIKTVDGSPIGDEYKPRMQGQDASSDSDGSDGDTGDADNTTFGDEDLDAA